MKPLTGAPADIVSVAFNINGELPLQRKKRAARPVAATCDDGTWAHRIANRFQSPAGPLTPQPNRAGVGLGHEAPSPTTMPFGNAMPGVDGWEVLTLRFVPRHG
jgi:hypothetical protein